jgi:hypothetical protein
MRKPELVLVHSFVNQVEAELAKSALAAAGIDAFIKADTAGGMRPHLASTGSGFQLLVRDEDALTAREVLEPAQEIDRSGAD